MAKFYVKSGTIKFVVDAMNESEAIAKTMIYYKDKKKLMGAKICVNEIGFSDFKNWLCFDIDDARRK